MRSAILATAWLLVNVTVEVDLYLDTQLLSPRIVSYRMLQIGVLHWILGVSSRDSKPEAFLLNPGFGFGKPQNPGFGSGSGLGKWRLYTSKTVN